MTAKEVIQEFKRIDGWQSKKKSALFMTKKDLAEYAKVEQESDQKKLNVLNEYHQAKSEEEAALRYMKAFNFLQEAIKEEQLKTEGVNTLDYALKLAAFGKDSIGQSKKQ